MAPPVKILIVDDNAAMRSTIRRIVQREGDECIECSGGEEAVATYKDQKPDWVLMDIQMNGMSGLEATEKMVAQDPSARVLMITDYGDRFFRRAAREAGARGFLTKEQLHEIHTIIRTEP